MTVTSPYEAVLDESVRLVVEALRREGVEVNPSTLRRMMEEPPLEKLGDLALPCFSLARILKRSPADIARGLADSVELKKSPYIEKAEPVSGYLNIFIDITSYSRLVIESILELGDEYGLVKAEKAERIVVEHTSANPVHPIHIGHARNSILGDTLYRMLKARGHTVYRRFFVNDMGRQVAILAYGYRALGRPKPQGKPDVYYGMVYSITNAIVEIDRLKKEIADAENLGDRERALQLREELDDWIAAAAELRERNPQLFDKLSSALVGRDHDSEISDIMRKYEEGSDREIVEDVREVVSHVIRGFQETLKRVGIEFDFWDWESDLAWKSYVSKVLDAASKSPYYTVHKGAPALSFETLQKDPELREKLELPKTIEIPPLILRRSDGTTLYTTRDIAYSILKFEEPKADRVINVIMSEQRLPQIQIRLALAALGMRSYALNMIHYSYEIVNLPGVRMSGRKGRYVTFDEIVDEAVERAFGEVEKRNKEMSEEEKRRIARDVGIGAVRYALVSVSASKPLTFDWENVLSFERNSGPYLQYTHARAANILRRASERPDPKAIDYSAAGETPRRRRLIKLLGKWPTVFVKACDELRPEYIVDYLATLADEFNSFYNEEHVIREEDVGRRMLKLAIVYGVKVTVANALKVLGIVPPDRM